MVIKWNKASIDDLKSFKKYSKSSNTTIGKDIFIYSRSYC